MSVLTAQTSAPTKTNVNSVGILMLAVVFGCLCMLVVPLAHAADATSTSSEPATPEVAIPQVARINSDLRDAWGQYGLKPSPPATENEWCRRVHLDLIGRIPSVRELRAFTKDKSPDKREALVDRLLESEDYVEEYARNWTTIWTNILIGRSGGMGEDEMTSRPGMQKYLRDSFARNKPYDRMVYELITANGTTHPGSEKFNGAVNFLANKMDEKGVQATAKTSQVFLGLQVQCTQCHNHPFNEWKQNQFWEMNAFFRQTRALRRFDPGTNDVRLVELANEDFGGEGGGNVEEAELFYEQRNGLLKAAYPVFLGTDLENRSGYLSDVNRREELAKMVIQSDYMSKAIVNRMWAHFLGYGFTKPYDDVGPHNPPINPELFQYLGEQFRDGDHDLKRLMKWIALSEPYSLSSRSSGGNRSDDPLLGETPKFTHFYLRQMRAEELYESLLVATEAHKTLGSYEKQEADKANWLSQFTTAFGTDEGGESTTFNGSIPQALMMFNGDLIKRATSTGSGSFLARVADSSDPATRKIEYLFMAGLARRPSSTELRAANKLVAARAKGDGEKWKGRKRDAQKEENDPIAAALQDVWWAILNTNEFILNH